MLAGEVAGDRLTHVVIFVNTPGVSAFSGGAEIKRAVLLENVTTCKVRF